MDLAHARLSWIMPKSCVVKLNHTRVKLDRIKSSWLDQTTIRPSPSRVKMNLSKSNLHHSQLNLGRAKVRSR